MNTRADGLTSIDDVRVYLGHLMGGHLIPAIQISPVHKGERAYSDNFGVANVEPQIPIAQHEWSS